MGPITRRQMLIGAGAAAIMGSLAPTVALAEETEGKGKARLVRWDLIQVTGGVIVGGGTDNALDGASGATMQMTGSGQAEPARREAAGGGTFNMQGPTFGASGVYWVTGFNSFTNAGGTLAGLGLTDGIGEIGETTGGVLSLNVRLLGLRGGGQGGPANPFDAVLTVNCSLPGSTPGIEEGIVLTAPPLNFASNGGNTLFHNIRGNED